MKTKVPLSCIIFFFFVTPLSAQDWAVPFLFIEDPVVRIHEVTAGSVNALLARQIFKTPEGKEATVGSIIHIFEISRYPQDFYNFRLFISGTQDGVTIRLNAREVETVFVRGLVIPPGASKIVELKADVSELAREDKLEIHLVVRAWGKGNLVDDNSRGSVLIIRKAVPTAVEAKGKLTTIWGKLKKGGL